MVERMQGTTLDRPFVYGNISNLLTTQRKDDSHTHKWTVFFRSLNSEDYSPFISQVVFKLHESFKDPIRIVKQPPYEVTEVGWGEFEITIQVHFLNNCEKPISIYHMLKLFEGEGTVRLNKRSIAYELYDELIFKDPPKQLFEALMSEVASKKKPVTHCRDWAQVEKEQLVLIDTARATLTGQLAGIATKRLKLEQEIGEIQSKMRVSASTTTSEFIPTPVPTKSLSTNSIQVSTSIPSHSQSPGHVQNNRANVDTAVAVTGMDGLANQSKKIDVKLPADNSIAMRSSLEHSSNANVAPQSNAVIPRTSTNNAPNSTLSSDAMTENTHEVV
eukprot:CFRG7083T1